jgi:hypothetical protein
MWAEKSGAAFAIVPSPGGGGGGGGGGWAAMSLMGASLSTGAVHCRAGFSTVETCQKALVLLRPSALTSERLYLSGTHVGGGGRVRVREVVEGGRGGGEE